MSDEPTTSSNDNNNNNRSSNNNTAFEVSKVTSERVCKHMNEDHAVSVYAMARSILNVHTTTKWQITDAKLKQITVDGCHLQVVTCSGDLCETKRVVYPLTPALTKATEIKPRLVAIHQKVLTPQWKWVWIKPTAFQFFVTFATLGYTNLAYGLEGIKAYLDNTNYIKYIYGSRTDLIALGAVAVEYIAFVAHICEAIYAAYLSRTQLKLPWTATLKWFVMVFATGFPILAEIEALHNVQKRKRKQA